MAAVRLLRAAADTGHADAQVDLGLAYERGRGVATDLAQAMAWYRKGAAQNNMYGMRNVGLMLTYGRGVPADPAEGTEWLRKAAELGLPTAMVNYAQALEDGYGIEADLAAARQWYQSAADQGNADGKFALARLYLLGQGVQRDDGKAFALIRELEEKEAYEALGKESASCWRSGVTTTRRGRCSTSLSAGASRMRSLPRAWSSWASCAITQGRYKEAASYYSSARQLAPDIKPAP